MRCTCGLSWLKPTHHAMDALVSNLDPKVLCTQMHCPHSDMHARLGLCPVSRSNGVVALPIAQVDVQFFSQMQKCMASPHRFFGSPDWCKIAQMRSIRWQFSDSATLLCCSMS